MSKLDFFTYCLNVIKEDIEIFGHEVKRSKREWLKMYNNYYTN